VIDAAAFQAYRARPTAGQLLLIDAERVALVATATAVAMLPFVVPRGPANTGPADVFAAVSVIACLFWAGSTRHRWRFVYALPMALFLAAGVVGAVAGPVPAQGIVAIGQDVFLLAWCWAVVNICQSSERLRVLLTTWVYSSIAWATLLFVGLALGSAFLTGHSSRDGSRTALMFGDPNVSANYYCLSIMIIWASARPRSRTFRILAYALLVAALISTGSNSGIVSLSVAVGVAGALGIYRRAGAVPALAAVAFISVFAYFVAVHVSIRDFQERAHSSRYAFIRDGVGRGEVSVSQRSDLVHESIPLYESGGPLGQGPVSTKPRLESEMAPFVKEAHDDYVAALLERGVLGFGALALLVATLVFQSFSVVARMRDRFHAAVVKPNALVGALIGTLVASTVYELLHVRHVWALFGLVAALYSWTRE
jgi:O-antigen ligase